MSWVASLAPDGSPGSSRLRGLRGDGGPGRNVLAGSGWALGAVVCIVSGSERSDECTLGGKGKPELAVGHMCPGGRSAKEGVIRRVGLRVALSHVGPQTAQTQTQEGGPRARPLSPARTAAAVPLGGHGSPWGPPLARSRAANQSGVV